MLYDLEDMKQIRFAFKFLYALVVIDNYFGGGLHSYIKYPTGSKFNSLTLPIHDPNKHCWLHDRVCRNPLSPFGLKQYLSMRLISQIRYFDLKNLNKLEKDMQSHKIYSMLIKIANLTSFDLCPAQLIICIVVASFERKFFDKNSLILGQSWSNPSIRKY